LRLSTTLRGAATTRSWSDSLRLACIGGTMHVTDDTAARLLRLPSETAISHYRAWPQEIQKDGGKVRILSIPAIQVRVLHSKLL
jgi:hypothetical protein